jgi:hypothetical protein
MDLPDRGRSDVALVGRLFPQRGTRSDAEMDQQARLQLLDRIRLFQDGRSLDHHGLHAVGDRLSGRVQNTQRGLAVHGLFRQLEPAVNITLQHHIGKEHVDALDHVEHCERLFHRRGRHRLMALFLEIGFGQHADLIFVLDDENDRHGGWRNLIQLEARPSLKRVHGITDVGDVVTRAAGPRYRPQASMGHKVQHMADNASRRRPRRNTGTSHVARMECSGMRVPSLRANGPGPKWPAR